MSRFILDVHETFGITMLLIEHDMAVVMSIAEQVVVLDFGQLHRRRHRRRGAARRRGDRGVPRPRSGGGMSDATTLPGLLEALATRRPDGVAFRQKRLGIWRAVTWSRYLERVREVALALDEMGVGAGDRVAVFADNGPRWLYADLGIQALGAASVGVYPALDPAEAASAIALSGATHRLLRRPGAGGQAPRAPRGRARRRAHRRLRRHRPAHAGVRRCAARGLRRLRRPRSRARRRAPGPLRRAPRRADGRRGGDGRLHLGHDRRSGADSCSARPARSRWRGSSRLRSGSGSRTRATRCFRSPTRRPASSTPTPRSSSGRRSASRSRSRPSRPTSSRPRPRSSPRRRACSSASGATSSSGWATPAGSSACRTAGAMGRMLAATDARSAGRRGATRRVLARPPPRRRRREAPGGARERALRGHRRLVRGAGLAALVLGARRSRPGAVRPGRDRRDRDHAGRRARPRHGRAADRSRRRGPPRRRAAARARARHRDRNARRVGGDGRGRLVRDR